MSRKNKMISAAAAVALAAIVLWIVVGSRSQKASQQPSQQQAQVPSVAVTRVVAKELNRQIRLPGELQAYQDVAIYPKVQSFVEWIGVDRGSVVKHGQLLCRMSAPEVSSQRSEAAAKAQSATSQRIEGEARVRSIQAQKLEAAAKLAADDATYKHLKAAAVTPGVVAGNDLETAQRTVEAGRARVKLYEENERAAAAQVQSLAENEKAAADAARSVKDIESYLRITAPFDGVITERNVHTGSLVGPSGNAPMLRIRQVSKLRLVVYVPEADVAGMAEGKSVGFSVTAYPGETFSGKLQRIAHSLDAKTRTMPVELDVDNPANRLAPGMYAEVIWPNTRLQPSLFVPPTAIAVTTERTFVVRIREGSAEWVDVKRGASMGDLVEVFGDLAEGDQVATRGTDELRNGARVAIKEPQ
jgi:RND family efflux transporter MFP subunit